MALIVPSAVLVRLVWTAGGTPFALNVLGARKSGATTVDQALANTLGAAIKSSFTSSALVGQVHTSTALASVGVRDISAGNLVEFMDAGAAVPGTNSTGFVNPPQLAVCVTLRTALAGKSYRGRVYLTGFQTQSIAAAGGIAAGLVTAAPAFVTAIRNNMTSNGLTMAIVSRKLSITTDVTAVQLRDNVWDTIRKRAIPGI